MIKEFEKIFNLSGITEMQVKTTLKSHLNPERVAVTQKPGSDMLEGGCSGKGTL